MPGDKQRRTKADRLPKLSIGLPVYNGGELLREAIDSILAQTFGDFELIISDNASTDGTEELCRSYAAKDARIRYSRHDTNRGAHFNQNHVVHLARGQYFKLAGHSDKIAPEFLQRCVDVLDANPSVVLCFTRMIIIDENGAVIEEPDIGMDFCGGTPHERLRRFFACQRIPWTIYGVIRSDVLKKTGLQGAWYGSDRALLQELALYGCFRVLEEHLFYHRAHAGRSWFATDRTSWWMPHAAGQAVPGYWMHLARSLRMLRAAPFSWKERALCVYEFARQGTDRWNTWAPILAGELAGVARARAKSLRDK